MKLIRIVNRFFAGASALALSLTALADFTQADLEKMVRELETLCTKHPAYKWPIKCSVVKSPKINAYASYEDPAKEGEPGQAIMVVFSGLVDHVKGDHRLVRAVVAHEVAHLASGHCDDKAFVARDLENLWTRQQEFEADILGASLLQRAGYSKKDMVDMLMMLDGLTPRKGDWLYGLVQDHATPKARAAEVAENPSVFRSLVQFDVALAMMESRKYKISAEMFEAAAKLEPKLTEAWTNRGLASLLFYWEDLPAERINAMFRPDFGEFIATPAIYGKAGAITDANRLQYADAIAAIEEAIAKSGTSRDREILALAQILHPDLDRNSIRKGVDGLTLLMPASGADRMRFVNNIAVGYVLLGDPNKAYSSILDEWKKGASASFAAAENLGRFRVPAGSRSKDELNLSKDILQSWLEATPAKSPSYPTVHEGYSIICKELGVEPAKLESMPNFFSPAVSITRKGKEAALFSGLQGFVDRFGKADLMVRLSDKYNDLFELRWGGEFSVVCERGATIRVTSYEPGDEITIKSMDTTIRDGYKATVGMSVDDLKKWLRVESGKERKLLGRGNLETWTYFAGLNMGLLLEGGKVAGITVTAIDDPED